MIQSGALTFFLLAVVVLWLLCCGCCVAVVVSPWSFVVVLCLLRFCLLRRIVAFQEAASLNQAWNIMARDDSRVEETVCGWERQGEVLKEERFVSKMDLPWLSTCADFLCFSVSVGVDALCFRRILIDAFSLP